MAAEAGVAASRPPPGMRTAPWTESSVVASCSSPPLLVVVVVHDGYPFDSVSTRPRRSSLPSMAGSGLQSTSTRGGPGRPRSSGTCASTGAAPRRRGGSLARVDERGLIRVTAAGEEIDCLAMLDELLPGHDYERAGQEQAVQPGMESDLQRAWTAYRLVRGLNATPALALREDLYRIRGNPEARAVMRELAGFDQPLRISDRPSPAARCAKRNPRSISERNVIHFVVVTPASHHRQLTGYRRTASSGVRTTAFALIAAATSSRSKGSR